MEKQAARYEGRRQKGGLITMPFIFANEACEKLAVVGFGTNMLSYLTEQLHLPLSQAANTLTNFSGTASLTPLIGAFISDSYAGRFWTLTLASIIYQLGMISLTVSAVLPQLRPPPCKLGGTGGEQCREADGGQLGVLYASLLLTALGSGGIRPCTVAFGADQLEEENGARSRRTWSFFNWYYFCMGVSILVAVTLIVYVQDNVGWGWGLGIPTAMMLVSILVFVAGYPLYRNVDPAGSPFTRLVQVAVAAYRKRNLPPAAVSELLYENEELDAPISASGKLLHTHHLRFLDKAAVVTDEDVLESSGLPNLWRLNTVHRVEELKTVIRMGPIWAAGILLITAYAQQGTFSLQQAKTMDRRVTAAFTIPAASMSVFTITSMLATIVLYDRLLIRLARRLTGLPRGITFLQRMGIGFVISTFATLVAGAVELRRKHTARSAGLMDVPQATLPISVFWLVPQYSLHGVAEAFMSIGHLEFFYDQAPESMRSTATALFWTAISVGNYVSTLLVSVVHKYTAGAGGTNWLPDRNLNKGKLEYFYWLITLLQLLNFIYYLFCAKLYTFKPLEMIPTDDSKGSCHGVKEGELQMSIGKV